MMVAMSQKRILMILFCISFLTMLGFGIIIPLLAPLFLDAHGVLPVDTPMTTRTVLLGLLLASFPLAQFFGAPLLGAWSDHHGRKKLLLVSLAGTFISFLLFALGIMLKNVPLLFFSRILDGFTGGNISIVLSSIADVSKQEEKAKHFGLIGMSFGLGFIFGPLLGGLLADSSIVSWFSYALPFWFAAAITLVNIMVLLRFFPETLSTKIPTKVTLFTGIKNIRNAFQLPHLRVLCTVIFLLMVGFSFFTQFFQVFLIDRFQFSVSQIGFLFAFTGVCIALVQGVGIRIVAKYALPEQILRWSTAGLGVIFLLHLIPQSVMALYFLQMGVALFHGLTGPNSLALISNHAGKESQGEIMGIQQSLQSLGIALPPLLGGYVVAFHSGLPLVFAAGCTLLAWLLFILFVKEKKKEDVFHEV